MSAFIKLVFLPWGRIGMTGELVEATEPVGFTVAEKWENATVDAITQMAMDEGLGKVVILNKAEIINALKSYAANKAVVPGHTNEYNIAEMAFHNGEIRMKEKVVNLLLGMQVDAEGEKREQIREMLERVKGL